MVAPCARTSSSHRTCLEYIGNRRRVVSLFCPTTECHAPRFCVHTGIASQIWGSRWRKVYTGFFRYTLYTHTLVLACRLWCGICMMVWLLCWWWWLYIIEYLYIGVLDEGNMFCNKCLWWPCRLLIITYSCVVCAYISHIFDFGSKPVCLCMCE